MPPRPQRFVLQNNKAQPEISDCALYVDQLNTIPSDVPPAAVLVDAGLARVLGDSPAADAVAAPDAPAEAEPEDGAALDVAAPAVDVDAAAEVVGEPAALAALVAAVAVRVAAVALRVVAVVGSHVAAAAEPQGEPPAAAAAPVSVEPAAQAATVHSAAAPEPRAPAGAEPAAGADSTPADVAVRPAAADVAGRAAGPALDAHSEPVGSPFRACRHSPAAPAAEPPEPDEWPAVDSDLQQAAES